MKMEIYGLGDIMVMVLLVLEMINTKVNLEKFLMTLTNTVELKRLLKQDITVTSLLLC